MGKNFLKLPKMGESVVEATLTKWLKEVGDTVEVDDIILEIATDKVDSYVPSEVEGVLIEKKFAENDVVQVGDVMAVIQTDREETTLESMFSIEALPDASTASKLAVRTETTFL